VTYYFNSMNIGPKADPNLRASLTRVEGLVGRYEFVHAPEEFEQVRRLYREVLSEEDRSALTNNICASLSLCRNDVRDNMLRLFYKVDEEYGNRVAQGLGIKETAGIFEKIGQALGLKHEKTTTMG
jgi:catalase